MTHTVDWSLKALAKGSSLSGAINASESQAAGMTFLGKNTLNAGVTLSAKNAVNFTTAKDITEEQHSKPETKSGGFLDTGSPFTLSNFSAFNADILTGGIYGNVPRLPLIIFIPNGACQVLPFVDKGCNLTA